GVDTARRVTGATSSGPPRFKPAACHHCCEQHCRDRHSRGWGVWPNRISPTVSIQAPAAANPQSPVAVTSAQAPRLSFVVLPLENLSKDPDQEYFAEGITDDLTTDLSRISGSFVIARNTASTYKGKAIDV